MVLLPVSALGLLLAALVQASSSSPYQPDVAACPASLPSIRNSSGLSRDEATWISARKVKANAAMYTWLKTLNLTAADLNHYTNVTNSSSKNVDIAISGGGYRSLLIGAGAIQALDVREKNGTNASSSSSPVAGFLQGTTYISGLSGGAWLLSSIIGNDYATVSSLVDDLWHAGFSSGLETNTDDPTFQATIQQDITLKSIAFDVSITDPWGRLLSYQLLNGTDGGVNKTLSGVTTSASAFVNHTLPFPIIQALGVKPSDCIPGPNATQYEFSPYEFGSWDSGVGAFVQTRYLGTQFSNSTALNSTCVTGFDNLGFILGTSSTLFPTLDACSPIEGNGTSPFVAAFNGPLMGSYNVETSGIGNDAIVPNPFLNRSSSPLVSSQSNLHLVDGGLALQNVPLWSLIQPSRNASLILAIDNSADISASNASSLASPNFPNGSEILTTYVQSLSAGLAFPVIPPVSTFLALNLTRQPTLFGCRNASVPTVVYLANAQHGAFPANQSTVTLVYKANETDAMIENGFRGMTQNGSAAWATCLGCFVVYEGNAASNGTNTTTTVGATTNSTMSSVCTACFDQYCYN